jgi:GNAT superfamily N-acetyltransferase
MDIQVRPVVADDLPALLPLLRGYSTFYGASPGDDELMGMARTLVADPDREGQQLVAVGGAGELLGFATLLWTWDTTRAARIAVMEDLFVRDEARGRGVGRELLRACRDRAHERGCGTLAWETAPDNSTAQRLYDATGASRDTWYAYRLPTD